MTGNILTLATFLQTHIQPDGLVWLIDDNFIIVRCHFTLPLIRSIISNCGLYPPKRRFLYAADYARIHLGKAETLIEYCQCGSVANSNVASFQLFHHAVSVIGN
jgi:hypothetical protein